jgi:CRP/FNR family transcriptional regulator
VALADARSRLASLLLDLGSRYGQPGRGGTQLAVNLSRGELAAMVGLTAETVMRLLSEFREEGILRTEGRIMTLLAEQRLKALALERPEAFLVHGH